MEAACQVRRTEGGVRSCKGEAETSRNVDKGFDSLAQARRHRESAGGNGVWRFSAGGRATGFLALSGWLFLPCPYRRSTGIQPTCNAPMGRVEGSEEHTSELQSP